MKRFFVLILTLVLAAALASCEGIGDGALIGNIDLNVVHTVCNVKAYSGDGELIDSFKMGGEPASELFTYMTEYEYDDQVIDSIMPERYMVVSFERYDWNYEQLSDVDPQSGMRYQYKINQDDSTAQKFVEEKGYGRLGHAPGLYQKIVEFFNLQSASNGYFCSIKASSPYSSYVNAESESGYSIYQLLTEGEFVTEFDRTEVEKDYYIVSFNGASDNTYYIYEDDFVEEMTWTAEGDDVYMGLGRLDGIYSKAQEIFVEALENGKSSNMGVKLNCLEVKTKSGEHTADDFSDVYCVYLDKVAYGHYLVYFNAVDEYELEEKIKILKSKDFVSSVSTVKVEYEIQLTANK